MTEKFDAIIIGTGQAGPSLAQRMTREGLKVAIIERKLFGGTCVNVGCIPTKALVASARAAHMARRGGDFGVAIDGQIKVDMSQVKARKDAIVAQSNNGVTNCGILEGGITEWVAQGKPVIKCQHRISLEGQVRAIAGSLIILGVVLGVTLSAWFLLLPTLVGIGLLHAGLTDSCLMSMLLSKLPLNRIGNSRKP